MLIKSQDAENAAVLDTAKAMCAAIRTAPKTKGQDYVDSCIVTGDEKEALAVKMEEIGKEYDLAFFLRDAGCVRQSGAVVLAGVKNVRRGLDALCQYCGHPGCKACEEAGGECVYGPIDLGIAVGSAVALAADRHIDNRVLFSAGRAAAALGLPGEGYGCVLGIPLAAAGKSPFFDRKYK